MIQRKSPLIRIIVQHKEISFVDLNLNVLITCGNNAIDTRKPAIKPITQ